MDRNYLLKEFYTLFASFECCVTEKEYEAFEARKKLLIQLSQVENSSMALYDINKGGYAFVHSKFDTQLNYPLNDIIKKEPKYFFDLMPLPDFKFSVETTKKTFEFFRNNSIDNPEDYKLIFEYRLSDPAGNLYRFLQQCIVLEKDSKGNIWLVLILNDLIPDKSDISDLQRKLIHVPSGKICLFKDEFSSSDTFLSKRETEVLGLLSQGLQSKQISDRLFISVNTVNNHRQKIIEKLNVENTYEALNYAKTIGII